MLAKAWILLGLAWVCVGSAAAQSAPRAAEPGRAAAAAREASRTRGRAAPAGEAETRVARARSHFVLGMQFFEVRAYRDAIREFELATQLAPSADVWFNIGRAREELGDAEQAKLAFERYLRDRVDAPDAPAVRARLRLIEQRIATGERTAEPAPGTGSLRLHLPFDAPASAEVRLDGRAVRAAARMQPIILPSGRHRLEVTSAGFISFRAELSIEPGMLTAAYPKLLTLSGPPHALSSSSRRWTWLAVGLAGASAIATGVLGALAIDRQSAGDAREARAWARRSDFALAGTTVCALGAALLYFVEAPEPVAPSSIDHARR